MKCPKCGYVFELSDYRVPFMIEGRGKLEEVSCVFEAYNEDDAVSSAKSFDEGFVRLVKVERGNG